MDWSTQSVLVTGGAGSFGRVFARMFLQRYTPRRLIIFSRDELKHVDMQQEFPQDCVRFFIGDVRETDRLRRAMHGVDVVIHAAALKQVPTCEYNPLEAIKTNIIGTANVIEAALDCGVERALFIGTDKAVNPINLYGASKLCAEKLFIHGNAYSGETGTRFSCARYGNVVASRGSVIPLFLQQRLNGVVTVTDERMTRFWLTLEQGVEFVLRCLQVMQGGEIFVPKIPSMRLMDLVEAIAPTSGVEFTGIRPGEKLHELLVSPDEVHYTQEYPELFVIRPPGITPRPLRGSDILEGGKGLPEGFRYGSDTNPQRLTVERLRVMLKELNLEPSQVSEDAEAVMG